MTKWPFPDQGCLDVGDNYLYLAVRSWAAGGLSDAAISDRLGSVMPATHTDAAVAVARHLAIAGCDVMTIIEHLVELAVTLPAWPDDPDYIAHLAASAYAEFNS